MTLSAFYIQFSPFLSHFSLVGSLNHTLAPHTFSVPISKPSLLSLCLHSIAPSTISVSLHSMRKQDQNLILQRSTSTPTTRLSASSRRIISQSSDLDYDVSDNILLRSGSSSSISNNQLTRPTTTTRIRSNNKLSILVRSFLNIFTFPTTMIPACKWLNIPSHLSITPSLGRKVTGTLFGHRRGYISFAIQLDSGAEPLLLLELAMYTASLVKEMSSGLVRIALECDKVPVTGGRHRKLFQEPAWTMYCNGRNCGYAVTRTCGERDRHVLSTVRSVSVGAGVIPLLEESGDGRKGAGSEGELMYMRARFERVVGSRDSEAFYMLNPDGTGGPELSVFLLRI